MAQIASYRPAISSGQIAHERRWEVLDPFNHQVAPRLFRQLAGPLAKPAVSVSGKYSVGAVAQEWRYDPEGNCGTPKPAQPLKRAKNTVRHVSWFAL